VGGGKISAHLPDFYCYKLLQNLLQNWVKIWALDGHPWDEMWAFSRK
jgi:hypothetical protein